MKKQIDHLGALFTGTPEEFRRHQDKLRKRLNRAKNPEIVIPWPSGTAAAAAQVLSRTEGRFNSIRDLFAYFVHSLAAMPDGPEFTAATTRTVQLGDMSKWLELAGAIPLREDDSDDEETDEND